MVESKIYENDSHLRAVVGNYRESSAVQLKKFEFFFFFNFTKRPFSLWTKNPWKSCELIYDKFTGFSNDFNGIFMEILEDFVMAWHARKSMKKKKNIKTS